MTRRSPALPGGRPALGLASLGAVAAGLAAGPLIFFTTGYALDIARLAFYFAVLTATWSFLSGVAGQFSFAHVAIAGLGGYAGAIWSRQLADSGWLAGVAPSTLFGAGFGTVIGVLLGLLLQRLTGAYLALFTIAFAEVVRLVVVAESGLTGGRLSLPVRPGLPGSETVHYYVMLGLLAATVSGIYALLHTRVGLNLRAMREDATAAAALGVNVRAHKLFALGLASAMAALAGSVYFHTVDRMAPENLDLLVMSQVIAYAVIGGLESPLAAGLAAVAGTLVLEHLREIRLDSGQILALAFGVAGVPVAIAGAAVWRSARRHGRRPLWTGLAAALPWAVPGFALFAWWLQAPPGSYGGNGTGSGWLTLLAAGVLVVRAGSVAGRRAPAVAGVAVAILVATTGVLISGKLYRYLEIDTDLGVWRLAVFGALLAVTLRFAPNGLLTPVLAWLTGRDLRRAEAVRHRDLALADNPGSVPTMSGEVPP